MKKVYVAGLYSKNSIGEDASVIGVLENIKNGLNMCGCLLEYGYAVFCPWLDFQYGLNPQYFIKKEMYKANSMAWLEVSDAMLVISGVGLGTGVDKEIQRAIELKIPIFKTIHDLTKEVPC